jgi:hypothetical protein
MRSPDYEGIALAALLICGLFLLGGSRVAGVGAVALALLLGYRRAKEGG